MSADELTPWERLADLPGGQKDPFNEPYGPTRQCLSSNDVARMFELGAEQRLIAHLNECRFCMERIERFSTVSQQPVPALHAAETAKGGFLGFFKPAPAPQPAYRPALIYVGMKCAVEAGRVGQPLRVQLLKRETEELKGMKCWVGGSIEGAAGEIRVEEGGYPFIEIRDGRIADSVRRRLASHYSVVEKLEVKIGVSADRPAFRGQSNVSFTKLKTDASG